jgi:AcrR family transcriptional regulator
MRRPGRPRTSPRGSDLEPREEILRHAARLLSAKGLGATRLADIADAVGVKAPAIYYHFANLDAIVAHLLDYVVDESTAFATRSVDAAGTSSERLRALIEHHVRRLTEGPYDLWFVAGLSDDDRARFPGVTETADRWRDAVGATVRGGLRRRCVPPDGQPPGALGSLGPGLRRAGAPPPCRPRRCGRGRRPRRRSAVGARARQGVTARRREKGGPGAGVGGLLQSSPWTPDASESSRSACWASGATTSG